MVKTFRKAMGKRSLSLLFDVDCAFPRCGKCPAQEKCAEKAKEVKGKPFPLGKYRTKEVGVVTATRHLIMETPPDSYVGHTLEYCGVEIVDPKGKKWSCYPPRHDLFDLKKSLLDRLFEEG